jgi:hypothetical protein
VHVPLHAPLHAGESGVQSIYDDTMLIVMLLSLLLLVAAQAEAGMLNCTRLRYLATCGAHRYRLSASATSSMRARAAVVS